MKSIVKWFNNYKGFGFIVNEKETEDIFVHYSAILSDEQFKTLIKDEIVEFDLVKTKKGYKAKNVISIYKIK